MMYNDGDREKQTDRMPEENQSCEGSMETDNRGNQLTWIHLGNGH